MDINLSKALSPVKLALLDTANKAVRRRMSTNGIRCRQKCAGCCSRYIRISMAEAVLVYEYLKSKDLWFNVRKRCMDQLGIVQVTNPLSWFKLNIPCPVLSSDKLCLAYQLRPAMCSTHFTASDPKLCDPWGFGTMGYVSIDFDDLYEKFQDNVENAVVGFGVLSMTLVIPSALLLAERITLQSGIDLKEALSFIFREL